LKARGARSLEEIAEMEVALGRLTTIDRYGNWGVDRKALKPLETAVTVK
jgi:hypothetical protein